VFALRSLTTDAQIDAGANNVVGVLDIDKCRRQERELRVQRDSLRAEIIMAVFDEGERRSEKAYSPPPPMAQPDRLSLARYAVPIMVVDAL
jgi:hypothetical protein